MSSPRGESIRARECQTRWGPICSMTTTLSSLEALSSADLLLATRDLVRRSNVVEADLLVHLGEVDERKLYLGCSCSSMFTFCVDELGFAEDAAYYRITVARAARKFPAIIDSVRGCRVHLAGLRLLVPHLTDENHRQLLAEAAGKSKRQVEELVARLAPQAPVPTVIRKLPELPIAAAISASPAPLADALPTSVATSPPVVQSRQERPIIAPLDGHNFKIQFTAPRSLREKLPKAQDPLRHRVPDGEVAAILGLALDALIQKVEKERFGSRTQGARVCESGWTGTGSAGDESSAVSVSRHIPDAVKRAVYARDGGRCTFIDERGKRCETTGYLEVDHEEGFARTHAHDPKRMRLLCRAHNQYEAERMYGVEFMERARTWKAEPTRPGASYFPCTGVFTSAMKET